VGFPHCEPHCSSHWRLKHGILGELIEKLADVRTARRPRPFLLCKYQSTSMTSPLSLDVESRHIVRCYPVPGRPVARAGSAVHPLQIWINPLGITKILRTNVMISPIKTCDAISHPSVACIIPLWLLGRPRRRWEDNIQMDIQEVGCGVGVWTGSSWLRIGTGGRHLEMW